jgi:hypothetical protein
MATRPPLAEGRGRAGEIARASDHACRGRFGRASPRLLVALMLLGATLSFAAANVRADSDEDRRVRTGARLFRALLAADLALESKARPDGVLHVLVYRRNPKGAQEVIELIAPAGDAEQGRIRGLALQVEATDALPAGSDVHPAGVFLATAPTGEELDRLVRWSIAQHVIVYSPFEGHVERGVTAGLAIEAKVQPYVNLSTLEAAGVELKPFFLKVAKVIR